MKQKQIRNRLNRGNVRGSKNDRARVSRRTKLKGGVMTKHESFKDWFNRIAKKPFPIIWTKHKSEPLDPAQLIRIRKLKEKHKKRREQ